MTKTLVKIFSVALALLLMLPMMTVFAEQQEADSVLLEQSRDVVFWVKWDVHTPDIVFLAPDGTVYDPTAQRSDTETMMDTNSMYYIVHKAQAGQWRVRYDKGTNTKLDVSVHDYSGSIHVETFNVGQVQDDYMDVAFLVAGDREVTYHYRISAVVERSGSEKELRNGTATTGYEVSTNVSLSKLSSYSAYMLKLYVWYDDNGTDIFDMVYSDPFSYTNTEADAQVVPYEVTILPEEYLVEVRFGDVPWSMESAVVALFEDDGAEPLMFDEYQVQDNTVIQLSYDPRAKKVAVEVTAKIGEVNAQPQRKTIDIKNMGITLPQGTLFNSLVYSVNYTGFSNQNVDLDVNGTKIAAVFNGSGMTNVNLVDDWNDFSLSYKDAQDVVWKIKRRLFVDRIPPTLSMNQMYDGISVDSGHITIAGTVTDCSKLTVNGAEVTFDAKGAFAQELSLSSGENKVAVVAVDKAGNEVQYAAKIYYGAAPVNQVSVGEDGSVPGGLLETLTGKGNYWVLLACGVIALLVVGYALVFWRKGEKR